MRKKQQAQLEQAFEQVELDKLKLHPSNPRRGNVEKIQESMEVNGVYGAVVVQRSTGHVLVGNHRLKAARKIGLPSLPVLWLDVDDTEAKRILLADNRTSDLGGYDDAALVELLQGLSDAGGLLGTGYEEDDLGALIESLDPVDEQPERGVADGAIELDEAGFSDFECKCPRCGFEYDP